MARAALSLPFSGLSGALGDLVVVQLPDGPVVRRRTITRRTTSLAQRTNESRLARVAQAWKNLDDETFNAWNAYAETQTWRNPASGAIVAPKAFNLFCGLASRARMIDPSLDLASFAPPDRAFSGGRNPFGSARACSRFETFGLARSRTFERFGRGRPPREQAR